jgi:hypothetical protein
MPPTPKAAHTGDVNVLKRRHNGLASEFSDLEETAGRGESEDTPWILLGSEWLFWAAVTLVVLLLALGAYWLAS